MDDETPSSSPAAGYRDVEVLFNNCSDAVRYRVYESMYLRAYDSFYCETPKFYWIVGYELDPYGVPSNHRTHANLANVCSIKIIGGEGSESCMSTE